MAKTKQPKKAPKQEAQDPNTPPAIRGQRILPGVDTDQFRSFLDLSSGIPTKNVCPKCGFEW